MHVGKRIKHLRIVKGMSLKELGKGIVSPTHLSNVENGRYIPSDDIIMELATKLDCDIHYLTNSLRPNIELKNRLKGIFRNIILDEDGCNSDLEMLNKKSIQNIFQELTLILLVATKKLKNNVYPKEEINQLKCYELPEENIKSIKDNLLINSFYYFKAQFYYFNKSFKKSLTFFEILHDALESDPKLYSALTYNLSLLEYLSHYYIRAIQSAEKALIYNLKSHNWEVCFDLYNIITVIYWRTSDLELALHYGKKALSIGKSLGTPEVSRIFHNLGNLHLEMNQPDQAEVYYNQAIKVKEKVGFSTLKTKTQKLKCYLNLKDYERFNKLYVECESQTQNKKEELILLLLKATYLKEKDDVSYIAILENINPLLKKENLMKEYYSSCKILANHYKEMKSYKSAFKYSIEINKGLEKKGLW
ncbi:helix-turn-helix domain-containing protein [Rossellomorea sp. LJF3]|uniref:helix-turn-helix domain-containing protein n=1 Tax=Rossellomorea sp. LJF3 TaxID=3126099 RepID=UPI00300D7AB9